MPNNPYTHFDRPFNAIIQVYLFLSIVDPKTLSDT